MKGISFVVDEKGDRVAVLIELKVHSELWESFYATYLARESDSESQKAAFPGRSSPALTTDLEDPEAVPYFLWDEPMTVRELRHLLSTASEPERLRLLGKILREARDTDVWRFTTLHEVVKLWPGISMHLGWRRRFWEFLLAEWDSQGLLESNSR